MHIHVIVLSILTFVMPPIYIIYGVICGINQFIILFHDDSTLRSALNKRPRTLNTLSWVLSLDKYPNIRTNASVRVYVILSNYYFL